MDSVGLDESLCSLPPPRDLLLSSSQVCQTEDSPIDGMLIDEPYETEDIPSLPMSVQDGRLLIPFLQLKCADKPQLPPISNMQPFSPFPTTNTTTTAAAVTSSDDYLRRRMSDLTMSSLAYSTGASLARSHINTANMSPNVNGSTPSSLEPNHITRDGSMPPSMSRRGSLVHVSPSLHHDYRRPSITELNSLPLPTNSGSLSRRGSVVTIGAEYDHHSSRSPSPFMQLQQHSTSSDLDYFSSAASGPPSSSYDPFHRRHSIATAESSYPSSSSPNRLASKQRPFKFPATIHESSNGVLPALSSPYEMTDPTVYNNVNEFSSVDPHLRTLGMRHSANDNQSHYNATSSPYHSPRQQHQQHQQQRVQSSHPYAAGYVRRRSILIDEDTPSLARRASMPVVTMGRAQQHSSVLHHPPTPTLTPPHLHHPALHQKSSTSSSSSSARLASESHDSHYGSMYHSKSVSGYVGSTDDSSATAATLSKMGPSMENEDDYEEGASMARKPETPYSRSPELRVSHKLAERKRRKEMKELFDELRDSLPVEKSLKTSKWEILSKAVEYISVLKHRDYEQENEVDSLRHELAMLKREQSGSYRPLPY